jgi:putative nucleotidyltransferase with HDIG domain
VSDQERSSRIARYLPHVVAATTLVLVTPSLGVLALERAGIVSSPLLSMVAALALSVAVAQVMSFLWMRHSGSRDLVFGDLMLWGWWKRLRTEKRLSDAIHLLGFDRLGSSRGEVFMSPQRQAEILSELATLLEADDPFTHGHSRRVARYSHMIAKTMHLPPRTVSKIRTAASVHDVGKIDTPLGILNKPGRLTDDEYDVMKLHSVTGAEMADRLGDPEITSIVRHHHERIDGRGYPDALQGDEIPLGARVIAVADTFDAITCARPYRKERSHSEAIEVLKAASGTQLDPEVVDAFLSYYSGRRSLTLWMSFSAAFQKVFGGFGDWVQHAQASGLSGGAISLGAALTVTALVGGMVPIAAGTHRMPAHRPPPVTQEAEPYDDEAGAVQTTFVDPRTMEDEASEDKKSNRAKPSEKEDGEQASHKADASKRGQGTRHGKATRNAGGKKQVQGPAVARSGPSGGGDKDKDGSGTPALSPHSADRDHGGGLAKGHDKAKDGSEEHRAEGRKSSPPKSKRAPGPDRGKGKH